MALYFHIRPSAFGYQPKLFSLCSSKNENPKNNGTKRQKKYKFFIDLHQEIGIGSFFNFFLSYLMFRAKYLNKRLCISAEPFGKYLGYRPTISDNARWH